LTCDVDRGSGAVRSIDAVEPYYAPLAGAAVAPVPLVEVGDPGEPAPILCLRISRVYNSYCGQGRDKFAQVVYLTHLVVIAVSLETHTCAVEIEVDLSDGVGDDVGPEEVPVLLETGAWYCWTAGDMWRSDLSMSVLMTRNISRRKMYATGTYRLQFDLALDALLLKAHLDLILANFWSAPPAV